MIHRGVAGEGAASAAEPAGCARSPAPASASRGPQGPCGSILSLKNPVLDRRKYLLIKIALSIVNLIIFRLSLALRFEEVLPSKQRVG